VGYLFGCTSSRLRVDSRRTQDRQIENELSHEERLLSVGRRAGATPARKIWDASGTKLSDVRPSGLSSTLRICNMLAFTDSRMWSCGRMGLMDRMGWAEADRWTLDCCCWAATCRATGVSRKFCWGPSRSKLLRIGWNGKVVGVARARRMNVALPVDQNTTLIIIYYTSRIYKYIYIYHLKNRQYIRCKPINLWKSGNYQSRPLDANPIDGVRGLKRKKKGRRVGGFSAKKSHLPPHLLDQHPVVLIGSFQVCTCWLVYIWYVALKHINIITIFLCWTLSLF